MVSFDPRDFELVGPGGTLAVDPDDLAVMRLAMLIEGECEGLGPLKAAEKYEYSKQRYFQIRKAYLEHHLEGLLDKKPGPKKPSRRTEEVEIQIIRNRFLDPEASLDIIAQKLRQCGFPISVRSVARVISYFGLQKKTLFLPTRSGKEDD